MIGRPEGIKRRSYAAAKAGHDAAPLVPKVNIHFLFFKNKNMTHTIPYVALNRYTHSNRGPITKKDSSPGSEKGPHLEKRGENQVELLQKCWNKNNRETIGGLQLQAYSSLYSVAVTLWTFLKTL